MPRIFSAGLVMATLLLSSQLFAATTITVLVANKKSAAYKNAKAMANDKTIFAERKLHKALSRVEDLIASKKKCPEPRVRGLEAPPCKLAENDRDWIINVKVAQGEYKGKGGRGGFSLSEVKAPNTVLRLLGGYDDHFKKRAPFKTPTVLKTGGTVFAFAGKNHSLKELYISGFVMDIGAGNKYDAKTNCLLKGESAKVQQITLGYLTTGRLVVADNVFVNSSHKAMAPLIRAKNAKAEVIIRNNFIMNNVLAWEADSARFKTIPARYVIEGNSFIMNWPYNPDPTTSNPAALQLAGKYATKKFVIRDNLFAYNMGGAIFWTAPGEKTGPKTEIKHNLFFGNGQLFSENEPGAAAVVTKFGGFKSRKIPWNTIDVETLEDDYDWDSEDNVVMDPKVPISMVKPGFANSADVSANNSSLNDVRGLLGMNKQGNKLVIKNYAPRMGLDLSKLPFATEPKAGGFGVSAKRVEQF